MGAKTSMISLDPLYQLPQPGTPTTATSLPVDPTMNHPYNLIPGTSTEIILDYQSASANMTGSCARDVTTSCVPLHQSVSPRTPAAAADLRENLLPPHTQNQADSSIILCLPAQQARARTINSQPIPRNRLSKKHASSSQIRDNVALEPDERPTTFWTLCPTCKMLYEYVNIFLNQELLCNECELPFMATKMPAPSKARVLKAFSDALHQNDHLSDLKD